MSDTTSLPETDPTPSVFNTSFTAYRASPLHLTTPLTPPFLSTLEKRLRDTLVGDSVRGISITSVTDPALLRAGPLERVSLRLVLASDLLDASDDEELANQAGLVLELQYENASGSAILLPRLMPESLRRDPPRNPQGDVWMSGISSDLVDSTNFLPLPLLLLRVPSPLKFIITSFLSTTFDCRIAPLSLPPATLISIWETWLSATPLRGPTAKDFVLTVAFSLPRDVTSSVKPDCGLRSLDVVISSGDLAKFVRAGKDMPVVSVARGASERQKDMEKGPFARALARHLMDNLALDIWHPAVQVVKIACGGFVLSDGRCKVFSPSDEKAPEWARRVIEELVERAAV